MAKGKGKKSKRKKKIGHSEAKTKKVKASEVTLIKSAPPAPLTDANVTTTGSESKNNVGTSLDKEKKNGQPKRLSGYIFMCNSTTKLDCYQYRVFGLSLGRKDMVEQIIPGIKLFLFDFEVKLLYGVYEATCTGKLNLEPGAFKGKFPAQVKFKISNECLPLPESCLRSVIMENYTGSKFKQEFTRKQVKKLLSTFRPLYASSSQSAVHALASAGLPHTVCPLVTENQLRQTVRLPAEAPYLLGTQYRLIQPLAEHQPISNINILHHGHSRSAAYVEHATFSLNHQSLPAACNYVTHGVQDLHHSSSYATHGVQDPHHASSYATHGVQDSFHSSGYATTHGVQDPQHSRSYATHGVQDPHHSSSYVTHGVQDLHHASSYATHGVQDLHHASSYATHWVQDPHHSSSYATHGVQDLHHSSSYATHGVQDLHHSSSYATHGVQDLHHSSSYATHGVQDLHHASSYVTHGVQSQHYSRSGVTGEMAPQADVTSIVSRYLRPPTQYNIPPVNQQPETYVPTYHHILHQDGVGVADHNSYMGGSAQYTPPVLQRQAGISQGSGPVTSDHSYATAHQSGN